MFSDEEIRFTYGKNVVISRKGKFVLVHLDRPSTALLLARTEEFDPEEYFFKDCELCQMTKQGGIVVYDDSAFEDDDVIVD
jgi:hypothetical protein